jgi:hypothetical protein
MQLDRLVHFWKARTRWEQVAVVVWCLLLAVLSVRVLTTTEPRKHNLYLVVFAEAARGWRAGEDLYKISWEPYRYSPAVAVSFIPLSLLPDRIGAILWRLLGAAVFLVGLRWWCRDVLPDTLTRTGQALLFLLVTPLALGNLHNGQANLLVIGLLLIATAAVATERLTLASVCLAVACLFKVYPIAIGLLLMLVRPWRLGWRLTAALLVGFLLPFQLQRPDYVAEQYVNWENHLAEHNDRQTLPQEQWYRDLRLLSTLWVTPMSYPRYQEVEVGAGVMMAVLGLGLRWRGVPRARLLLLLFGLGCCWMTLLGPATESSTYVLLGPVGAWLAISSGAGYRSRWQKPLFAGSFALLLAAQLASATPWGIHFQKMGPQPFAALLMLFGLAVLCGREIFSRSIKPSNESLVSVPARAA